MVSFSSGVTRTSIVPALIRAFVRTVTGLSTEFHCLIGGTNERWFPRPTSHPGQAQRLVVAVWDRDVPYGQRWGWCHGGFAKFTVYYLAEQSSIITLQALGGSSVLTAKSLLSEKHRAATTEIGAA
jgi:hypothetical protein